MAALRCVGSSTQAFAGFRTGKAAQRPAVRTMASLTDTIKQTTSSNKVVIYSKTYCPYCSTAKGLFEDLKVPALVLELDKISNGADVQQTLQTITGSRTVPQIFIGGKFIGGCDDTLAAHRAGTLKTLLSEVGITAKM